MLYLPRSAELPSRYHRSDTPDATRLHSAGHGFHWGSRRCSRSDDELQLQLSLRACWSGCSGGGPVRWDKAAPARPVRSVSGYTTLQQGCTLDAARCMVLVGGAVPARSTRFMSEVFCSFLPTFSVDCAVRVLTHSSTHAAL